MQGARAIAERPKHLDVPHTSCSERLLAQAELGEDLRKGRPGFIPPEPHGLQEVARRLGSVAVGLGHGSEGPLAPTLVQRTEPIHHSRDFGRAAEGQQRGCVVVQRNLRERIDLHRLCGGL